MIITAINAKGGVGKTTTTMFLATVFANRGKTVIATMRSLSLQNWSERTEGSEFRGKRRVQEFKPLSVKAL
jgi:chromosome partitioning protein